MRSGVASTASPLALRRNRVLCGAAAQNTKPLESCRALVLDAAFRPLAVINWHRAVTLDVIKAVEVLEYYDCFVKTVRADYPVPAVLRSDFVKKGVGRLRVALNRKNVMKRDRHTCVYCGLRQELTLDHIIPISRGGAHSWENLVTACKHCNHRKGDRSLEQMGWKLKVPPKKPAKLDLHFMIDMPLHRPKEWQDYISHLHHQKERELLEAGKIIYS